MKPQKPLKLVRIVAAAIRPTFEPVSDRALKDQIRPVAKPRPEGVRPADARPRPAAV